MCLDVNNGYRWPHFYIISHFDTDRPISLRVTRMSESATLFLIVNLWKILFISIITFTMAARKSMLALGTFCPGMNVRERFSDAIFLP